MVYFDASLVGKGSSSQHYIVNPLTAELFNLNFHPLEVVSRCRDPQLQVSENYSDLTKWRSTDFKYNHVDVKFYLAHAQKEVLNVLMKNENPNIMRHRRLRG